MESSINQKEKYNKKRKIPNFYLTVNHKRTFDLNRTNGSSFNFEKPMKSFFNENDSLLKKINQQNKILSLNNTLYNKNINSNISLDIPFNIKLLYKCKRYLNSLDNEIIKGRKQLNKIKKITKTNQIDNNSLDNNNTINNGKDYKTFYNYNGSKEKNILNKKLTMINFTKSKELNLNNIRTFKYNSKEKLKNNQKLLLKEKKLNNLSEYSTTKNKQKRIFNFRNNITNNLSTTLKGSLSTSNINNKINLSNNLLNLNNKSKEDSRGLINYTSIDKKQSILLNPIKNMKAFNSINNKNKKKSNIKDIIIPELPTKKNNNKNNIKYKEISNEQPKNNLNLKINTNNNNIINNYEKQLEIKENINTNNFILQLNKSNNQLKKSDNNIHDDNINKKIFNTNTDKLNNIFSKDEEDKKEKENGSNDNINQNNNTNNNNEKNDNKNNKKHNTFKKLLIRKRKTKIFDVYPSNKKLNNNKFLEKIKTLNTKYQNKDEIMTHQIKLNKKSLIEKQGKLVSKLSKKKIEIYNFETGNYLDLKIVKNEYIEKVIDKHQDLEDLINNYEPKGMNNKIKNGAFTPDLVRYIFRSTHFSSVFLPLVDITNKRKSFLQLGKLYIINNEIKVFEDGKSKFVEKKTINCDMCQETAIHFIHKELLQFSDFSEQNNNFLDLRKVKTRKGNFNSPLPKRNLTYNDMVTRIVRGRNRIKKSIIEKITMTSSMIKKGIKPISILDKDEFFEVRRKRKNNIENRFKRRRNSIIDPFILKSLSYQPLDYIKRLKNSKDNEDHFTNLKKLIKKGEVSLFFEYFQENCKKMYINRKDENGNTLLILALKQGLNTICKLLIKNGIDVNIQNNNGNSALHYALSGKNYVVADELRIYGALENCKNKKGFSPWECIGKNIDD